MKKRVLPNDCKAMFNDRFNTLNMKELGIELKHFTVGTAPESPSFLVNQDELKKKIIEKFTNFFDEERTQGLEIIFLKSNYGNGKTHFIRTIYSFLSNFENVLVKKVSLKQEKTDLKTKILEGVGQKIIKQCATYLINNAIRESQNDEKNFILLTLTETLSIDFKLAELFYQAAYDGDISKQTQAIAILKGNYLPDYLKTFKLKKENLNSEFYFNVISLVCNYLLENNIYLVIVFDEYEHINTWKDDKSRKEFFSDIKYFTDNIDPYKNLFFIFAESESGDTIMELSNDPAYVSRKKNLTYTISDISSNIEIEKLYKMIKNRYEKYYEITFDEYTEEILKRIKDDSQVKSNSNYRNYTNVIMKVLEEYRINPPKIKKNKKKLSSVEELTKNNNDIKKDSFISIGEKWNSSGSISKKTILCEAMEYILDNSNEKVIEKSKKTGIYKALYNNIVKVYYIVSTDKPTHKDFTKRYDNALRLQQESEANTFRMIYPFKEGISDCFEYENVFFYHVEEIPNILEDIYKSTKIVTNVDEYLHVFELEC